MSKLTTELNKETMLKLARRAARAGLTLEQAAKMIILEGKEIFLAKMVAPTK